MHQSQIIILFRVVHYDFFTRKQKKITFSFIIKKKFSLELQITLPKLIISLLVLFPEDADLISLYINFLRSSETSSALIFKEYVIISLFFKLFGAVFKISTRYCLFHIDFIQRKSSTYRGRDIV